MPTYNNALTNQPANRLAYPGGLAKRGGSLDSFVPLDYSRLAAGQFRQDTPQMREYAANVPVDVMRGRLAGMLGFPSDVLNMFRTPSPMEMFGQTDYEQPTQVPYGSEQFLKTLPLAPAENNPLGRVANRAGSLVPFTPMEALQAARMARQAAMATGKFVAPKAGQLAEQYMVKMGAILPLDVYHGSPHRLPPTERNPLGEFDASKIGTGEGAQVYGHGIYTAEARPVAEEYAAKLSKPIVDFTNTQPSNELEKALKKQYEELAGRTQSSSRAQAVYDLWNQHANPVGDFLYGNSYMGIPPMNPEQLARRLEIRDAAKKLGPPISGDSGNLYKVDLPDKMISKMLDFDKPLSEQHPDVQKALKDYELDYVSPNATGGRLLEEMDKAFDPATVSMHLRNAGIPGVKYLDKGSRGVGKGTRNFVTFPGEEKNLTILERNGQKATRTNNLTRK